MRLHALTAILILAALQGTPSGPPGDPKENGIVEGVVRFAGTGEPIEAVSVTLFGPEQGSELIRSWSVRTDSKGHFIFRDVRPDKYTAVAGREGYYSPDISENKPITRIEVKPRQHIDDVVLELLPLAIISGRILGADGEPLVGASVTAGMWSYTERGERLLYTGASSGGDITGARTSNNATTDDRGEYRIFGLKPGEYYLGTRFYPPRADLRSDIYYPGTFDASSATRLVAAPGAELTGINFKVPALPVTPGITISGVVLGAPAGKPIEALYLVRHGGDAFRVNLYRNMAGDRSQGRFQIRGVPPGIYDLYPEVRDDQKLLYTARVPIEIGDRDVDNLTIHVQPGVDLRGRFVMDGPFPASSLYGNTFQEFLALGVGARLEPLDGAPRAFSFSDSGFHRVDPKTGEFLIPSVPPGLYTAKYDFSLPRGVYLGDVRQNGLSVFDNGFTIGNGSPDVLEYVFKSNAGQVEGTARDAKQVPVKEAQVVLVPQPSRSQNSALYRTTKTDKDGHFSLRDIAPGSYTLFAWTSVPNNAWRNAEFMAQNESRGQPLRVDAGATSSVQVTVLPKVDP